MFDKTAFEVKGLPGDPNRIWIDGKEILPDESQKIRNHSPDGFNWGYGGSGPAQAALAICLHLFRNQSVAQALYQKFKFKFVAGWPQAQAFSDKIDITDFLIDNAERIKEAQEDIADFH